MRTSSKAALYPPQPSAARRAHGSPAAHRRLCWHTLSWRSKITSGGPWVCRMTATEDATSPNFGFLAKRYPELEQIAARSEHYFSDDPIVSLITLRQRLLRDRAQHRLHFQGQEPRRQANRQGARRPLRARRLGAARPEPGAVGVWRHVRTCIPCSIAPRQPRQRASLLTASRTPPCIDR